MTNLYEWSCGCGATVLSRCKPPKPFQFVTKVPLCPKCQKPGMKPTGKMKKHYTLRELL